MTTQTTLHPRSAELNGASTGAPEWARHAVFYEIFPDRFAKSARVPKPSNLERWEDKPTLYGFKGGDLVGVVEKLDHLEELGVNAIYLTPIFQSTANHRYHTHDYFRVDPILGGNRAFRLLLDEAHARGMRVIIDGVFNHASRGFYQFSHALENGAASPYLDWFHIHGFPLHAYEGRAQYECWWGIPALPKLNTQNPAVREFIFEVAQHWIQFGADGWRLDVPAEIDDDTFWREFRRRVRAVNPEAYIVGEIWHDARRWLQGDQFDAVMNYLFTRACLGFFIGESLDTQLTQGVGYAPVPVLDGTQFAREINHLLSLYDESVNLVQFNLLGSHDTARLISLARGDVSAVKLATLCLLTYPGAPCIYYGDEMGMAGSKDPDCRRAVIWDRSTWNLEIFEWTKRAVALRHAHRALRDGKFQIIFASNHTVAYLRQHHDERLIVIFNVSQHDESFKMPLQGVVSAGEQLMPVFGNPLEMQIAQSIAHIRMAARDGVVLRVVRAEG